MIVNNFDKISEFFDILKNKEDFYYIQIIQRKKDGHDKSERVIKNFYIYNKEDFLKKKSYIIELCRQFKARAYFWINPRNANKITLECIKAYANALEQNDCSRSYKIWDKQCGLNSSAEYTKFWIVDLDNKDKNYVNKIIQLINTCRGNEEHKVIDIIPTFNGFHLITVGFDVHHFKQLLVIEKLSNVDVHKNNPTLLYYEENGRKNM